MSATIITRAKRVECLRHVLVFDYIGDRGNGYVFDCDADGSVDVSALHPLASDNYRACLSSGKFSKPHIDTCRWHYIESATARCSCGRTLTLDDPLDNFCTCGRCYNMSGQEVIPSNEFESQGE